MNKYMMIKVILLLYMVALGCYAYGILPSEIPVHWGVDGTPDKMGNKLLNIIIFPVIVGMMIGFFPLLSKIDPKKENYEKFGEPWEMMQIAIIGFFTYIYTIILYLSLHAEKSIISFMMFGMGILFMVIGNYMGKIRQNYFIGIKVPWTLSDEEVWNKTHRFGGKIFVAGGMVFLINIFIHISPFLIFIITLIAIVVAPIVYSYQLYKRVKK